ncbi:hypothetical protein KPC_3509 [Acinetobacter stercoris]|uniref:Uncharacterized protein n=2 Tax=Acinetobacter stercoris TaxID=2126983 RepID=A0A2U3N3S9_9GAMM|nr:hypothetical protein KPC_3509 [Acinetobacter stercoris]
MTSKIFKTTIKGLYVSLSHKNIDYFPIYDFERILTTPVPVPMVTDGRQRLAATQIGSLANSERTFMPCYIIYDLDNNIAQSFKTVGKAC